MKKILKLLSVLLFISLISSFSKEKNQVNTFEVFYENCSAFAKHLTIEDLRAFLENSSEFMNFYDQRTDKKNLKNLDVLFYTSDELVLQEEIYLSFLNKLIGSKRDDSFSVIIELYLHFLNNLYLDKMEHEKIENYHTLTVVNKSRMPKKISDFSDNHTSLSFFSEIEEFFFEGKNDHIKIFLGDMIDRSIETYVMQKDERYSQQKYRLKRIALAKSLLLLTMEILCAEYNNYLYENEEDLSFLMVFGNHELQPVIRSDLLRIFEDEKETQEILRKSITLISEKIFLLLKKYIPTQISIIQKSPKKKRESQKYEHHIFSHSGGACPIYPVGGSQKKIIQKDDLYYLVVKTEYNFYTEFNEYFENLKDYFDDSFLAQIFDIYSLYQKHKMHPHLGCDFIKNVYYHAFLKHPSTRSTVESFSTRDGASFYSTDIFLLFSIFTRDYLSQIDDFTMPKDMHTVIHFGHQHDMEELTLVRDESGWFTPLKVAFKRKQDRNNEITLIFNPPEVKGGNVYKYWAYSLDSSYKKSISLSLDS